MPVVVVALNGALTFTQMERTMPKDPRLQSLSP